MLRTRAVRQILLEDVCGLSRASPGSGKPRDVTAPLRLARRRAVLVIALDWVAILILVLVRAQSARVMDIGPNPESVFSIGLLAIAVHSGFRLGQLEKMRAVQCVLDELAQRSQSATETPEPR